VTGDSLDRCETSASGPLLTSLRIGGVPERAANCDCDL